MDLECPRMGRRRQRAMFCLHQLRICSIVSVVGEQIRSGLHGACGEAVVTEDVMVGEGGSCPQCPGRHHAQQMGMDDAGAMAEVEYALKIACHRCPRHPPQPPDNVPVFSASL